MLVRHSFFKTFWSPSICKHHILVWRISSWRSPFFGGSTDGVGGSRGTCLIGSTGLSLLFSPAPPESSWTTSGEIEVEIIGISRDD